MPNTKSAERRMRSNARKQTQNRSIKSRLKSLEKNYVESATKGNKEQAETALREVVSALDKATKSGVIHKSTASRKKSRLAVRMPKAAK